MLDGVAPLQTPIYDTLAVQHAEIMQTVSDYLANTLLVVCFAPCANSIAPAAKSVRIRESAFLGWHCNDRRFDVRPVRDEGQGAYEESDWFRRYLILLTLEDSCPVDRVCGARSGPPSFEPPLGRSAVFAALLAKPNVQRRAS